MKQCETDISVEKRGNLRFLGLSTGLMHISRKMEGYKELVGKTQRRSSDCLELLEMFTIGSKCILSILGESKKREPFWS